MRSLKSESEDLERRAEATQWGGQPRLILLVCDTFIGNLPDKGISHQ